VSYAVAAYALVLAAVLAYAARLWRARRRLAATLRARSGQIAVDSLGTRGV
jgi:hypothetical protein